MIPQKQPAPEDVMLDLGGDVAAHARLMHGEGDTLVVLLHGAVDRTKRDIPFYQPFFKAIPGIPQMAVADPGMDKFAPLAACWYLGWTGRRIWEDLGRAIREEADRRGFRKRIYLGGSTGGFAALLLGHADPGSIVIARNPQTNISAHVYGKAAEVYLNRAWGDALTVEAPPLDVGALYAADTPNRVILLQSPADLGHVFAHSVPFLAAIRPEDRHKIVYEARYHGIPGHGGSVPDIAAALWVRAAIATQYDSPNWAQDILDAHFALTPSRPAAARPNAAAARFNRADLNMASRLSKHLMGSK